MALKNHLLKLGLLFIAVLAFYTFAWRGMEHLRTRNGPWVVRFTSLTNDTATVTINNHKLGITNALLRFTGTGVPAGTSEEITFDKVTVKPPFGKFFYQDLTFLPGVITMDLFGHQVELRPRNLAVGTNQIAWKQDLVIERAALDNPVPIRFSNVPGIEVDTADGD